MNGTVIETLLPLWVGLPLVAAAITAALRRNHVLRHVIAMTTLIAMLCGAVLLVIATSDGDIFAHHVGLWVPGIAIPFVGDMFSALMLTVTGILIVASLHFAIATGEAQARFFSPFVLVLAAGVSGAVLTGDLFNLFVFIEVMLLPSYGILVMMGARRGLKGGRLYVTVNLMTSTIFLVGVGLIYAVTGTVNIAELAGAAKESTAVAIATGVALAALATKAAVVPVHGWLTRTYPMTSPAVTALFSGLHTKVAIYAIYRIYGVLFDGDTRYLWVALVITSATMFIGVMGAMGERTTRSILVFHMISQIGYILLGVGLFTVAGLTAAIFYLFHHMIVKASLFLSTGAIEETYGTGELTKLGGMSRREPLVAVVFMMAALSLAGLPPFSGFVAKFTLIAATLEAGHVLVVVITVVVSLFTLLSMLKIWTSVFNSDAPDEMEPNAVRYQQLFRGKKYLPSPGRLSSDSSSGTATTSTGVSEKVRVKVPFKMVLPGLILALISLGLGLGGELLLTLSEQVAAGLLDSTPYVEAVLNE